MGQGGSNHFNNVHLVDGPRRQNFNRAATLPHEPLSLAPKVLPELSPRRLRSTDNGAILQSGGTISGRRPFSASLPPSNGNCPKQANGHSGVYRSRSASSGEQQSSEAPSSKSSRYLRERDPLHRSQNHLDLHKSEVPPPKKFGSEPDLRHEEQQQNKPKPNKHFRKKYKAPPPPVLETRDGSSPDSYDGCLRSPPNRKLRLFRTRTESKNQSNQQPKQNPTKCKNQNPSEIKGMTRKDNAPSQWNGRRYQPLNKDRDPFLKYDNKDMIQSSISLRKEENILQNNGCPNKTKGYKSRYQQSSDKTSGPYLDRNFRYSERFKKEETEVPVLRRERSFDATVMREKTEVEMKKKIIAEQLRSRLNNPPPSNEKRLQKSLPSLLSCDNERDEFQNELKRTTAMIKNEFNKSRMSNLIVRKPELTSQNEKCKINQNSNVKACKKPYTAPNKPVASSPVKLNKNSKMGNSSNVAKINQERVNVLKSKENIETHKNVSAAYSSSKNEAKRESRLTDRGQASGKESSPERSPARKTDRKSDLDIWNREKPPSKQFYFGMVEPTEKDLNGQSKIFPGLGAPIADYTDFSVIERKLLGYHQEDEKDIDSFVNKLRPNEERAAKNVSSESALSSEGDMADHSSDGSKEIDLHLRPTIPKKQLEIPRFSPAAAWRQLTQLEAELEALNVETKMDGIPVLMAESPTRSDDKSGDKSGDSGISGDQGNSDQRLDSPARHQLTDLETWTPQQDLEGESGSDTVGDDHLMRHPSTDGLATYTTRGQPFSLSLPRETQSQDKTKQFQQPFNSLQKLKKSVSGALGAALTSRKFDLENEPFADNPSDQNWFLSRSAPNSLRDPYLMQPAKRKNLDECLSLEHEQDPFLRSGPQSATVGPASYMSWSGHVMYLPPAPALTSLQPQSKLARETICHPTSLTTMERPIRSKSSGEIELRSRNEAKVPYACPTTPFLCSEMREREGSASPAVARAMPALAMYTNERPAKTKTKRFTFQSTVRQLERKRLAEKLSREADLKEQQRKTELEAMRRVEEEFQRKRAREKANIRQQLRLVTGNANCTTPCNNNNNVIGKHFEGTQKTRDEPDGAVSSKASPSLERLAPRSKPSNAVEISDSPRRKHQLDENKKSASNTSSEISAPHSGRSKSTTPVRCVVLSEWRESSGSGSRQYRDWGTSHNIDHPPACFRMPKSPLYLNSNGTDCVDVFTGSPRSDNYRLEFARGATRTPPRTPAPFAPRSPHSSSGSELSSRRAHRLRSGLEFCSGRW